MNPQQPFSPQGPQPQQSYQPPVNPSQSPQGFGQPYVPQQGMSAQGAPMYAAPVQPMKHVAARGGASKGWIISTISLLVATLSLGGLAGWALVNYSDQKNNVDSKVSSAVALAVKEQKTRDAAERLKADKEPNRIFAAGDDLGQLSFKYPKTWSVYEATAQNSNSYEVILNPGVISGATKNERYALRLTVKDEDYNKAIANFERLVSKGDLQSSAFKVNEQQGTRFDGLISKDVRGSVLIFKLRDKTVTVQTDAETFRPDFDTLISTITFNK